MKDVIVIDLDGTLCDIAHREQLIGEWDEFNAACKDDIPHEDIAWLVRELMVSLGGPIFVGCTGRSEKHRIATERWLLENDCLLDIVLMRGEFDFRSDADVKVDLLQEWHDVTRPSPETELKDRVLFVLEDRDKVVEAWRGIGLNCWQVREGAF